MLTITHTDITAELAARFLTIDSFLDKADRSPSGVYTLAMNDGSVVELDFDETGKPVMRVHERHEAMASVLASFL